MEDLAARRRMLRESQNADGGWGYFRNKQSWLEPTALAGLALVGDPDSGASVEHARTLVRSWQNADGGWRPNASIASSTWATALALIFANAAGVNGSAILRGLDWLLAASGAESSLLNRVLRACGVSALEREVKYKGWPWRPGTSAWVEPTAHALVALAKAGENRMNGEVAGRIDSGCRMLLSVRCTDGGWNYGSPRALGVELPSYPETTAVALVGLQKRAPSDAVEFARRTAASDLSPLARAWLAIALRLLGASVEPPVAAHDGADVLLSALRCLGDERGNWRLLRVEHRT